MTTQTQHIQWCITHACTKHDAALARCTWDVWAGPRPGRGKCQIVEAVVELEGVQE